VCTAPPTTYNAKCVPRRRAGAACLPLHLEQNMKIVPLNDERLPVGQTRQMIEASNILMIAVPFATVTYSQVWATSGIRRKSACPSAQQCCDNLLRSYEGSNYTLDVS
jgi:hypothetical protein